MPVRTPLQALAFVLRQFVTATRAAYATVRPYLTQVFVLYGVVLTLVAVLQGVRAATALMVALALWSALLFTFEVGRNLPRESRSGAQ